MTKPRGDGAGKEPSADVLGKSEQALFQSHFRELNRVADPPPFMARERDLRQFDVKERGAVPDVEARLRSTIVKLKETITNKNAELARLREDVPALVRDLTLLTAKDETLRQGLQLSTPTIIPLHARTKD
ncbi:hypothetical protein JHN63_22215 [Streptomyces sp. MBT65]|uniref:hypothetical protein n=1 Tax=Streptomyces sp. MBT65 TaxID=1488395 RepID=UPI00190C1F70|nr:hypothetical protein [Streptomyces sp. MBT65]MBK3576473.1 hypothetical protein [Streptomyces sp. MBT65]